MKKKAQRGVTLLESILVLAVASLMLIVGIKMYQSLQNIYQLQQLRYKVDQLFEAASDYYRANCAAGDFSPRPPVFLSPYRSDTGSVVYPPAANAYYPVSISSILLNNGYLEAWYPESPIVDSSGGESGYVVQLNPLVSPTFTNSSIPVNANACVVTTVGENCLPITPVNIASPDNAYSSAPSTTISTAQAKVITWAIQVAVKIQPQSKITSYAAFLGADCMSDSSVSKTVDACSAGNSSHKYLVWTRIPSLATKNNSVFSASMQLLKSFNYQYTHDSNYEFNAYYSTTTTNPPQAPVYYLCGG